jgi:hypothetical protein
MWSKGGVTNAVEAVVKKDLALNTPAIQFGIPKTNTLTNESGRVGYKRKITKTLRKISQYFFFL